MVQGSRSACHTFRQPCKPAEMQWAAVVLAVECRFSPLTLAAAAKARALSSSACSSLGLPRRRCARSASSLVQHIDTAQHSRRNHAYMLSVQPAFISRVFMRIIGNNKEAQHTCRRALRRGRPEHLPCPLKLPARAAHQPGTLCSNSILSLHNLAWQQHAEGPISIICSAMTVYR